jgi:hypothetical protein
VILSFPLIDGPLAPQSEGRDDLVRRMAADLVTYDAFRVEADAIRSLMAKGYSSFAVLRFVDDARQVAMQEIVAAEMVKP